VSIPRSVLLPFTILAALTAGGTLGYVLIERASFMDALFMTVTTLSTVGYGEIIRLSPAGRLFTMLLIVTGVGTALYLLTAIAEQVVEGRFKDLFGRNAMQRRIEQLEGHVVVCGFGRLGRVVAEQVAERRVPLVIVDADPGLESDLVRLGMPYIIGSALSDDVLERAGVRRARALVAATASDPDNVFITLSAREKNPAIVIHARGESDGGLRRLRLAGADQAISAYQSGGMRIAASILRPSVVDFLEISLESRGEEVDLEQVRVGAGGEIVGRAIESLEKDLPRLRIVALKRGTDPILMVPEPATLVTDGDQLVVIGERRSLEALAQMAQRPR